MKMEGNVFDIIAEIYDISNPLREDISFWLKMAEEFGDPILELGCGTGRILIPIAEAGYKVLGLDISKKMLNILMGKIDTLNDKVKERITIRRADFRDFKIEEKFSMAFFAYSTLYSATTQEEQITTIRCINSHLKKGGVFITASFNPDIKRISENHKFLMLDFTYQDPTGELLLTRMSQTEYFPFNQTLKSNQIYDIKEKGKPTERYAIELNLRYIFPPEMRHMLYYCGFEIIDEYGDYNLAPLKENSPQMIFVAKKVKSIS
ncbi:MAG: class I SAM-dependent methyltransferase [bacterium]